MLDRVEDMGRFMDDDSPGQAMPQQEDRPPVTAGKMHRNAGGPGNILYFIDVGAIHPAEEAEIPVIIRQEYISLCNLLLQESLLPRITHGPGIYLAQIVKGPYEIMHVIVYDLPVALQKMLFYIVPAEIFRHVPELFHVELHVVL